MRYVLLISLFLLPLSVDGVQMEYQESIPSVDEIQIILFRVEAMRNPDFQNSRDELISNFGKCGLRIGFDVLRVWEYLTPSQKTTVLRLFAPVQMQQDTVIGKFRIHYDTTDSNEPALLDPTGQRIPRSAKAYVDSVGKYFNDTWSFEIDMLGYTSPPFDSGQSFYNVYIIRRPGFYGGTFFDLNQPTNPGETPPRYASYIEIDIDFQPFFSTGILGLKVTAAHEFHHAIQLGSYGYWNSDLYFYEITSTWMEDVAYNDVNDYYQYIKSAGGLPFGHFAAPHRSFNVTGNFLEYSRAIWGKYVEKRFSRDLMRRTWELMRQTSSLSALNRALNERQSNLREAYNEFSLWNHFTGPRADTVNFYSEGRNYPEIRVRSSLQYQSPLSIFSDNVGVESLGAVYYKLYLDSAQTISVSPILVKTNLSEAGNGVSELFQYIVRSDAQGDGSFSPLQIQDSVYWVKVGGVNNPSDWTVIHTTDSSVFKPFTAEILAYPNPFYLPQHGSIRFQIPNNADPASVSIFSSSMELMYSADQSPIVGPLTLSYFRWDGRNTHGEYAASGIYFYIIHLRDQQYKGKFTLLRK